MAKEVLSCLNVQETYEKCVDLLTTSDHSYIEDVSEHYIEIVYYKLS